MKKILSILLIFVVVFSSVVCVYAEEDEKNDIEVKEYYFEFLASSVNSFGNNSYKGQYSKFTVEYDTDIVMYLVRDGDLLKLRILVCLEDGTFDDLAGSGYNLRYYAENYTPELFIDGCYLFYGEDKYEFYQKTEETVGAGGFFSWRTSTIEESGFVHTNIPIFSSEELARGYLGGSVSISESENFITDIAEIVYDSQEVPMPRNLHIEYDNYRYYIVWEYTTDDLKKITLVSTDGMCMGLKVRYKNIGDYLVYPVELDFDIGFDYFLEPQLSYKIDITDDISALRYAIFEQIGVNYDYKVTLDYYIVSRWDKSELERHMSNFAHVKLYISDSDEGFIVDFDTCITDKNNTVLDDGIFDSNISISTDSSSFIGNIVSAFGLLGDNGLIGCCKAIFSCFPSFIWDLLAAGLSAGIVIFLIKLLFS